MLPALRHHGGELDGDDWVMLANVVGMSQYADGALRPPGAPLRRSRKR